MPINKPGVGEKTKSELKADYGAPDLYATKWASITAYLSAKTAWISANPDEYLEICSAKVSLEGKY